MLRYMLHFVLFIFRFCCNQRPDATLESETEEMSVVFKANWTTYSVDSRRGFKAVYLASTYSFTQFVKYLSWRKNTPANDTNL